MDHLTTENKGRLTLTDSRTNLAMRRASFVRMDAVNSRRRSSKKKRQKLPSDDESTSSGGHRKRKSVQSLHGKPDTKQDITASLQPNVKAADIRCSQKKGGPPLPMPFFSPQLNFQKAFKMFPDLTVSFSARVPPT